MNYEESVKRLEEIVAKLEEGGVSLEESIALYNEGKKLSSSCREMLDNAADKMKVSYVSEDKNV